MEHFRNFQLLQEYLEENSSKEDEILHDLRRFTYLKAIHPRMLSGPLQGKFLEILSKLIKPEKILEIGTFTGYSAICLARGLRPKGSLISIDVNDELQEKAMEYFLKAGLSDSIKCITGDACKILPTLKDKFDIIFIDGEKEEYPEYYELSMPLLKQGGIILADNVLWDGKVLFPDQNQDTATSAIIRFNKLVESDKRVENVILPVRDGISIIRKKITG